MPTTKRLQATSIAALGCLLLLAGPVQANSFPAQSLIIPTQASYQDPCGMVSTYGLVYSVLRANDGLRASKPVTGTGSFSTPITIHWVYSTLKKSPNRCVPTNLDTVFNGKTKLTSGGTIADTAWNDGCDITLNNVGAPPATLINNSNTASTADTAIVTIDTTTDFGNALAFPNFQQHPTGSEKLTTLQYAGGAFVISASDAPGFLDLLSGKSVAQDAVGHVIKFDAFKSKGAGSCSTGTTTNNGNTIAVFTSNPAQANVHQVNIHRSQVPFTADDNARMNGAPPKIGLLQSVDHDFANESGNSVLTGLSRGSNDPILNKPIVGTPTGIKGTQLRFYLASAGLDFPEAGGCPPGGYNDPTVNTYDAVTAGFCQGGNSPVAASGQIYDNLDARDFNSGLINGTTGGKPNYTVIWAPHWEGRPWQTVTSGSNQTAGCNASCISGAQAALATFLDDTSTRRGFLGECATVGFMEGAVNDIEELTYNNTCNPGYATGNPNSTNAGCFPNERFINNINATESLTCTKAGSVCAAPGTGSAQGALGLTHDISNASTVSQRLNNCTDPTTNSAPCIQYGNPNSAFSQIGDYRWFSYSGGVGNYFPTSSTMYTPGTQRLLYTVNGNFNTAFKTALANDPASLSIADNVSLVQRGNDNKKATMIYLAGHNYTPDIAGTRIALNTLLALGLVLDTKESAFVGPTIFGDNLVVPTYNRITNSSNSIPSSYITFTPGTVTSPGPIKDWLFPYHTGTLHVDSLTQVAANGGSTTPYNQNQIFQQKLPDPGARNIFTYLGGHVSTSTTDLQASALPSNGGRGVAQVGWTPVNFSRASIDGTGFFDQYHISQTGTPAYAGMVAGSNNVSDLQEALELTITKSDLNSDQGLLEQAAMKIKLILPSEINNAKWLIQMVRGYCYPTAPLTNFTPAQSDCQQTGASNVAQLGGIVHSQPAVVPASPLIPELPTGKHRPTVVYVGALDGQLHAFYMPSDTLDSGYTGPAATLVDANSNASSAFTTSFAASFAAPAGGTELWSFIPPGQLPLLQNNNAQVDSSPAVTDVFGDFDGTGVRTWRTVLVASAGGSNREIFALDVTNPLKPVLLWDIQSSFDSSLPYAPSVLADNDTGIASNAEAFNWQNRCRIADVSAGTCRPTKYLLPPATDAGRSFSGLFNYSHLGASQSVSTGVLRRSNAPVYGAFVATNEAGGHGIYIFGIDLVTGAKLWEWNNPYDREAYNPTTGSPKLANKYAGTANSAPAGIAIISRSLDDQVNLVYAGDDEGSLWELNAEDGINTTAYSGPLNCNAVGDTGTCNYSLSQAYGYSSDLFGSANADTPQPVSTLPTVFTIRSDVPASGIFNKYVGQAMLAYGTGGTDAVASITPQVSGAIHLIPLSPLARDTPVDLTGASGSTRTTHAANKGVDYEAGVTKGASPTTFEYPKALTNGERVYGDISVDQSGRLFFGTTTGSVTDIDSRGSLSGNIYQIDTASTTPNAALSTMKLTSAAIGGVGGNVAIGKNASGQQVMVVSTDKDLQVPKPTAGSGLSSQAPVQPTGGLLGWFIRLTGRE